MGAVSPQPTSASQALDLLPDNPYSPRLIHIGVDVGQVHDPTAIVVAELAQRKTGRYDALPFDATRREHPGRYLEWTGSQYIAPITETVYLARHLERIPLGTRYPDVAQRIADIACAARLQRYPRRVLIDQTGVGRPIVELVSDVINSRPGSDGVSIRPITFTSGMEYDPHTGRMGKAFLVSRLQVLLQWDRLKLPAGHLEAQAIRAELKVYSIKVSQDGADTYGAFKIGQFDDLATALGLACLEDPNEYEARSVPFSAQGW